MLGAGLCAHVPELVLCLVPVTRSCRQRHSMLNEMLLNARPAAPLTHTMSLLLPLPDGRPVFPVSVPCFFTFLFAAWTVGLRRCWL